MNFLRKMEKHQLINVVVTFALFCLLAVNVKYAEAYQLVIAPGPDGNCVYRGDSLDVGIHTGRVPCQRLTCNEDGSILVEGCGKLSIADCNLGERLNREKPFPECCKFVYKCKNPDGSAYYIERDALQMGNAEKSENST